VAETYNQARERQIASSTAYASMGAYAASNAAAALAARIRANDSFYTRTLATADPVAFSNLAASELDSLRTQLRTDGFGNNANYLQALLRANGMSKGTTPLGTFSYEDTQAFRKAVVEARLNGVEYLTLLKDNLDKGGAGATKTKFSKEASTALNLIDKSDAATMLGKAFYAARGEAPPESEIVRFMNKFNARAKKEAVTTTTAGTTTTSTGGTTGKSTTTRSGLGFTAEEQNQFLASYIAKRGGPVTPETGGAIKTFIDEMRTTYKNNNLAEPAFEELAKTATDIVGIGDPEILKQKLEEVKQKIRNQAAKLNPGMADVLAKGEDLKDYADQYIKVASAITRKNYDMNNPLIKKMMNFKDEKGNIRAASDMEAYEIIRGSSDWDLSPDSFNTFSSIGDIIDRKIN
jgi:hypothetical protein